MIHSVVPHCCCGRRHKWFLAESRREHDFAIPLNACYASKSITIATWNRWFLLILVIPTPWLKQEFSYPFPNSRMRGNFAEPLTNVNGNRTISFFFPGKYFFFWGPKIDCLRIWNRFVRVAHVEIRNSTGRLYLTCDYFTGNPGTNEKYDILQINPAVFAFSSGPDHWIQVPGNKSIGCAGSRYAG